MTTTADALKSSLTDRQAVALTVFGEARREPLDGQHAIAWVIRNRLERPARFGHSWKGVCHRKSQFSCWYPWGGESNYAAVMAAAERVASGFVPAPNSALGRAFGAADDVMAAHVFDVTFGADHYYAPKAMVPPGRVPDWAHPPGRLTVVIGNHRFYAVP